MAIVGEKIESRKINSNAENPSAELTYWAYTLLGESDALFSARAVAPNKYDGLIQQGATVAAVSPALYDVSIQYGPKKPREPGDSTFSFDVSTSTQHITQSISTIGRWAIPGREPTNFGGDDPDAKGGPIGVSSDGTIEGCDIIVPEFSYSEEHTLPDSQVTTDYVGRLFRLTGKMNDANFKHFRQYECLFLGSSGRRTSEEKWRVSFSFLGSPSIENIKIGKIANIRKDGWDVLWVLYEDELRGNLVVKTPVEAHVEQVYYPGDFSDLGIGT